MPGVTALSTTRIGGRSRVPWRGFNLGHHVGDDPGAVKANRVELLSSLPVGSEVQWLEQVHGAEVVEASGQDTPEADACWSREPGMACAVMTADCLPVLFASNDGQVVAAAHAGWRGLLDGVLENAVAAMDVRPGDIVAWMGPAIGPAAFEVGPEVREAFLAISPVEDAFVPSARADHYLADIYQLARHRLAACGIRQISGGDHCTYTESERFFSYRRDGQTGRMASLILINPGN